MSPNVSGNNAQIIIYKAKGGKSSVGLYARDGDIYLNQNHLTKLFATSKKNIGQHIENILENRELDRDSVVKKYFITAADVSFFICAYLRSSVAKCP